MNDQTPLGFIRRQLKKFGFGGGGSDQQQEDSQQRERTILEEHDMQVGMALSASQQ